MQLSQVVTSSGVLMHVYSAERHQQQPHSSPPPSQQQQQQQQVCGGDFRVPQSPGVVSSSTGAGTCAGVGEGGVPSPPAQHHHQLQLQQQQQQQQHCNSPLHPAAAAPVTATVPPSSACMRPPAAPGPRCKNAAATTAPAASVKTEYSRSPPMNLSEEPTSSIPDLGMIQ